jgi:hypothetical protein
MAAEGAGQDTTKTAALPAERIADVIRVVRGRRAMLDADLAALYGVATRVLVQAVKRNLERFPAEFVFRLANQEVAGLRSQFVISNLGVGRGGRRYLPYAFTEHGALMAAMVLNTPRAVEMSRYVVRAFVRLRDIVAANARLAQKLDELERRLNDHDEAIVEIVRTIRQLTAPPPLAPKRRIGFV